MMVFSRTVWCGAVVVVVFVVVVCSLFLCVGALLGVWDNMVVLVDHSCGFCGGVAGCVLVVLHGAMWLVCCVRTV
ncbi:hypothetical protein FRC0206_01883 [Corynebacterium diphtheriae]|nr:hypothetical protein FRC0206_01883 [Corynebacterium diphtheriae]CAB0819760.1 hypothetical protein FRC0205_02282 [Corynebacterium diphtheriae]